MKKTLAERVKEQRDRLELSQIDLATRVGVSQQAIGMLETGRTLKPRYIFELAKALHVSVDYLKGLTEIPTPQSADISGLTVRAAVQAGHWSDSFEWPVSEWYVVPMPPTDPRYPDVALFGLEVRGESMNKVFPPGTVLACIHIPTYPVDIAPGKYVVVERIRNGEYEGTVKQLQADDEGDLWLVPQTTIPALQRPIRPGLQEDGSEVRITGLVVRSSRPE